MDAPLWLIKIFDVKNQFEEPLFTNTKFHTLQNAMTGSAYPFVKDAQVEEVLYTFLLFAYTIPHTTNVNYPEIPILMTVVSVC